MYREIAEVKSALRGCLDFCSHGYADNYNLNIVVVLDGCTSANDRTLQSLQLELCTHNEQGGLGDPYCNEKFGCLVYRTTYAGLPIEILVKGSNVQKGKRFSQILSFDYISSRSSLPDVVVMQDCDTYMPANQMYIALGKACKDGTISCPSINIYTNIFYDGFLPLMFSAVDNNIKCMLPFMQRLGCCPLIPGPLAVYPYDALKRLMELYGKELPNNDDALHGNKMLVEDRYMGWCATAAGLVPSIEFHHVHCYWNLPGRLFALLRQRRRWNAGQLSTSLCGHPQLGIERSKVVLMELLDAYFNIFNPVFFHGLTTLYLWRMIVDYYGKEVLFLFASPFLRVMLSPFITENNDGWFMVWVCVDSLLPFAVLPWTFQPFSQELLWLTTGFNLMLCTFFLIFAGKYGGFKAMEEVISTGLNIIFYEQTFFEMEYAMVMFHDITWGNREVRSDQPVSKLNIRCHTGPNETSWAGAHIQKYRKTFVSWLLTVSPFIYRVSLVVILYFKLVPKDVALETILCLASLTFVIVLCETIVAPKIKFERSYEPGSSIKLPGPILEFVNLDECEKVV